MTNKITKIAVIFSATLLCSCSAQAEVVSYLGCDWVIPYSFNKVADGDFTKLDSEFNHSSIGFRIDDDPEGKGTLEILNDPAFITKNSSYSFQGGFEINNLFLHRLNSDSYSVSFLIKKDGYVVSMVGVSFDDAITLSQNCIEQSVLRSVYDEFDQWKQDI
jgi:hypothetical protein